MRSVLLITAMLSLVFLEPLAGADSPPAKRGGARPDIAAFQFERQAQLYCGDDDVVWVIASRGIYNASTERWYGQTNNGAFACLHDATRAGYRASTILH
ncbi:MAG: hypothetical protein ACLQJR_32760 [Stellaceae bacterium]